VNYSSKTINQKSTFSNRQHFEAFAKVKEVIGDWPLVLEREFSYLELLENLVFEGLNFVIRLKVGPKFTDQEGRLVGLTVSKGETQVINQVFVNLIGVWKEGFSQPMWVMTNLKAEDLLDIYLQRMKIEESFRDLKTLLGMDKLMSKRRDHMEKMVVLLLIAYTIAHGLGETLRETVYPQGSRKQKLYSDLFVFLKLKIDFSPPKVWHTFSLALSSFNSCLLPVRSNV
jgi:transposase